MPDTIITVRGSSRARVAPEHAIVSGMVAHDGAERTPVLAAVTAIGETLSTSLAAQHDAASGPVTRWSAQNVRLWSERPWGPTGTQLDPVFHAQLAFSATFIDAEALARWVDEVGLIDGVTIHGVTWGLTLERERAALAEVRAAAVSDARERAAAFGASLGLTQLEPIAIADPGMLGDVPGEPGGGPMMMRAALAVDSAEGSGSLSFTPDDLELSAAVDARFVARRS